MRVSGTEGYAEQAEALVALYEGLNFVAVHGWLLHLLPPAPGRVLDVGAGTGRDAAALAAMGHAVVAVEPTAELRERALALHPLPQIEWLDDHLPDLARVAERGGEGFDAVLLTAVWMHLDPGERRRAMPRVARLMRPGGLLALTLRHGPVPPGRRIFEVGATETIGLAAAEGLAPALRLDGQPSLLGQPNITWTCLAFSKVRKPPCHLKAVSGT